MSFPRYEAYKDSGVEWLGEVPRHWQSGRIKTTTYLKGRVGWKGLTSEEYLEDSYAHLVTGTDFKSKFIDWTSCHCVERERYEDDPFIQLVNGDLLITKDGTIGKLALVTHLDRPACLNSGIFLVRPEGGAYLTSYMYWVLSSPSFKQFCDLSSFGSTIMHLYQNVFEQFTFPLPPPTEQSGIVAFLDRETAKVDALVQEQQQLIDLLKEKRQAVISHAVTKGLNPHAPMKDSRVEWLGEVPEHWEVKKLKYLVSDIKAGPFGSALTKDMYVAEGYRVYGQEQVIPGDFRIGDYYIDPDTFSLLTQYQTVPGDVLISCVGTFGKVAIVPPDAEPGIINPRLIRLRCGTSIKPSYLAEVLRSRIIFEQFSALSRGGTMDVINIGTLNDVWLPVPSLIEQDDVRAFLSHATSESEALMRAAETAIALLQERRSALISAAVTGKIDVRGLVSVEAEAA